MQCYVRYIVEPYAFWMILAETFRLPPFHGVTVKMSSQMDYFWFQMGNMFGTVMIIWNRYSMHRYWRSERGQHLQTSLQSLRQNDRNWEALSKYTNSLKIVQLVFGFLLTGMIWAERLPTMITSLAKGNRTATVACRCLCNNHINKHIYNQLASTSCSNSPTKS